MDLHRRCAYACQSCTWLDHRLEDRLEDWKKFSSTKLRLTGSYHTERRNRICSEFRRVLPRAPLAHPCICQFAMVSKSTDCRPRRGTCRLGKNKTPIKVNVKCKYCKLFRCASHCDCSVPGTATYGMRTGREAPRKSQSVQQRVQP